MKIFKPITAVFRFLFGAVSYELPGFILLIVKGIKSVVSSFKNLKNSNRIIYNVLKFGLPIVIIGLVGYGFWQSLRPAPEFMAVEVQSPPATGLWKGAEPYPLKIEFAGSAAVLEDMGKPLVGRVMLNPAKKGEWKWDDDQTLVFVPETDWPAGRDYKIKLEKGLFPDRIKLKNYNLSFKTEVFQMEILSGYFDVDVVDETVKQIAAEVEFSHPVDPASFEKHVILRPDKLSKTESGFTDRDYKVKIEYDEFFGRAYILSEQLPMPVEDVNLKLTIKSGVKCRGEGQPGREEISTDILVPGVSNFIRINYISLDMIRNKDYQLEQMLVVDSKGRAGVKALADNLEAWVLPLNRPAEPGQKAEKNYFWSSASEISPAVIKLSTSLELEAIPAEHEYEALNSFKTKVQPGRFIYVRLNKGTPFYGGYSLAETFDIVIRVENYPKQIEIMHEGTLLSSTGEKKISIMQQGLKGVQYRVGRVQPDQINHLVTQTNGRLTDIRFENWQFSEENIVENFWSTQRLQQGKPGEPVYFSFDFSRYMRRKASADSKYGIFFFEVRNWDPVKNRTGYVSDKRLVFVSDLGVLVKNNANGSHDVFVQFISSGMPAAGARVEVLGKNGISVLSTFADADGHVRLPSFNSYRREKTPVAYLISQGNDLSFLPVDAPGRWLDYSSFGAGGEWGTADSKKVRAYLFSERGIYRPGDLFHVGMIVKSGDWSRQLTGTPLEAVIIDARGLEIYKKKFKLSAAGFEEIEYQTEGASPTGTYQINLYTIRKNKRHNMIGTTTIEVEEFLPDRLKISSNFPDVNTAGWVSPEKLQAEVRLKNLFGTAAAGNRVSADMALLPGMFGFKKYKDYQFADPFTRSKSFEESLEDQVTNEQGRAVFNFNLSRFEPAIYTLHFSAFGYEKEGGRSVYTEANLLISPLPYLIGVKADGDLSFIYKNLKRSLKFIAIDSDLEKIDAASISFELQAVKQVSVLTKGPNGSYAYKSVEKNEPISSFEKVIPAAGLNYLLPTDKPGEYELILKNSQGLKLSSTRFSVVGRGNFNRSLEQSAELEIKLNKHDFKPGDEIEVYVKAPYAGAGLITIERDRVYTYSWFSSKGNSFFKKIRIPVELEGNGYVNVSFVRAADSKEIYMSPLSYGVAPFSISKDKRINKLKIEIPEKIRAGEDLTIKYSAEKSGKIAIFAVDEGILQVANYASPDPLGFFYKKRALEVRTAQIMDLILPEFSIVQSLAAMGGGVWADEALDSNINPFKRQTRRPVVFWSGIKNVGRKTRRLKYTVPDYFNGTLRIMAVAVSSEAVGRFSGKLLVRNPLILSPNLPAFTAPGDSFGVSLTVTNLVEGSGSDLPVLIKVKSSKHLSVSQKSFKLKIDEKQDTTITVYVKAEDIPGAASLKFTASGGGEKISLESFLSVRPAQPYQTRVQTGIIKKGKKSTVSTPRRMYDELTQQEASVSLLPVSLAKGLKSYLDSYAYGCSEQLISRAMPYLCLAGIDGFNISEKDATAKIDYTIRVLQTRQNSEGLMGVWAANSHTSDFISAYSGHFLTECRQAGLIVPETLFRRCLRGLKKIAARKSNSLNDLRVQAYAIYLLTLNEMITTNYIAALRDELDSKYPLWKDDITAAYLAASYELMQQKKEALKLIRRCIKSDLENEESWYFGTGYMQKAQLLYLLAKHFPAELRAASPSLIAEISTFLQNGSYNSIHSAYSIMALSSYQKAGGQPVAGEMRVFQVNEKGKKEELTLPPGYFSNVDFAADTKQLEFENKSQSPLYFQVVQAGFERTLPIKAVSKGIEVQREFISKSGKVVQNVKLGDELWVRLKLRSLSGKSLLNIAIVDMLPAGLEALPREVRESDGGSWSPDYIDIREDRLVFFGRVDPKVKEYSYKVRAINRGRYTVPPLFCESMYDEGVYGYSPQKPFIVK